MGNYFLDNLQLAFLDFGQNIFLSNFSKYLEYIYIFMFII